MNSYIVYSNNNANKKYCQGIPSENCYTKSEMASIPYITHEIPTKNKSKQQVNKSVSSLIDEFILL